MARSPRISYKRIGRSELSWVSAVEGWPEGRRGKPLSDADRSGIVEVRVEGDGNSALVHNHVYHLSENPRALRATRDAFLPLGQDGFDSVKLRQGDEVVEEIDWSKVEDIVKSCNIGIKESKEGLGPVLS